MLRERENAFEHHQKCVEKKGNNKFIRASVREWEKNLHSTIEPFKDGMMQQTAHVKIPMSGDDESLFRDARIIFNNNGRIWRGVT